MTWMPLQGGHAIERVRISVSFLEIIPTRLAEAIAQNIDSRRADFGFSPVIRQSGQAGIQINFGPGVQVLPGSNSWRFDRKVGEDNIVEVISISGNLIYFESSEYSRWSHFCKKVLAIFDDILTKPIDTIGIAGVNLEYFDRFIFMGEKDKASPTDLFEFLSPLLAPAATSGEQLWHLHRGWFEDGEYGRILVNQNHDAQDGVDSANRPLRSIAVYTKTEQQFSEGNSLETSVLPDLLTHLHKRNKLLFFSSLSPHGKELLEGVHHG